MTYKKIRKLRQGGVTFLELLIVMGLLSVLLMIILTIFTATISNQAKTEAYAATVADGRFIQSRLNYDIARASSVTLPASLGASAPSLTLVIGGVTYTYSLSSGNLQLTDAAGTANLNDDNTTVTNVSFQELGNSGGKPTIRYSFTVTAITSQPSGPNTITLTNTVGLR